MMLILQEKGCCNINVVTLTHDSAHIVLALDKAASKGLKLPLVYNTCGWERVVVLKILDGIVDVYLPDFKYSDGNKAAKYSSGADTYVGITPKAILELHRQVGTPRPTKSGLIKRGLMTFFKPKRVGQPEGAVNVINGQIRMIRAMGRRQNALGDFQSIFNSRAALCPQTISISAWLRPASIISFLYLSGLSSG
jgi:hypothetical protein